MSQRTIDEIGVTVVKFANGLEAWLKPTDFKADEIQFTAYAPGGLSLADSAAYVTAWMSPFIVNDNGVGGFKNTELRKMLAGKIVRVRAVRERLHARRLRQHAARGSRDAAAAPEPRVREADRGPGGVRRAAGAVQRVPRQPREQPGPGLSEIPRTR